MSKVSTIYDTMITRLAAIFPTKKRIPNPYNIGSNPQQYLDDGYGLALGTASQVNGQWCDMTIEQTFNIVLARKLFKNDTDPVMFDNFVKALREDVVTLQKDFYNVNRLNIPADLDNLVLGSVSSINEISAGKFNVLSIEIPMIATIRELL